MAQGLDVGKGGIDAAETEMRGNLAVGGGQPLRILFSLDEAEDLLLAFSECFHTEQMFSTRAFLSRGLANRI